jgi:hypothetical protein
MKHFYLSTLLPLPLLPFHTYKFAKKQKNKKNKNKNSNHLVMAILIFVNTFRLWLFLCVEFWWPNIFSILNFSNF